MGRLSRYKKVKSIDPFAKNGSWKSDVGDCKTLGRVKRKSKTALKMKEQKMNKQRRMRGKDKDSSKKNKSGGSNGWGDDDGYDLPPDGEDEFDMNDMVGSVRKQRKKDNPLLEPKVPIPTVKSSRSSSVQVSSRKTEKVNDAQASSSKNSLKNATKGKVKQAKYDGSTPITASTPTSQIIEACNNPKLMKNKQQQGSNNDVAYGQSKQDRRKAFFDKKKLNKKRKKRNTDDSDDEEYAHHANQQALESLHSSQPSSAAHQPIKMKQPKKHLVKQANYSNTMIARTAFDDQVERPPTFTTLPRGASKLAKNQKKKNQHSSNDGGGDEDDHAKDQRIRKEQQALEAMRQQVMRQYAALRESRRNGGAW